MPAEPRGDWSPARPNHSRNTDMGHMIEDFHAYILGGNADKTVRKNARAFLKSKIETETWGELTSVEKGRLVSRLTGLYKRLMEKGLVGAKYYLASGIRAAVGQWVRDASGSVHYIVGLAADGAKVVNLDTLGEGSSYYAVVPYDLLRFQGSRGNELILNSCTALKNACALARHLHQYQSRVFNRALFRFTGNDIRPTIPDEQVATIDFPATIRGERRVKLFCNFVTDAEDPDYVLFQHVRFGAQVTTRCDTRFTQCSFETAESPIRKQSGTVTLKKCNRVLGQTTHPMDTLEEDADTDDDQPEIISHETPEQAIERRRQAAEDAGDLIDLSRSVEPPPAAAASSSSSSSSSSAAAAPAASGAYPDIFSSSEDEDDNLCARCGRRWDGNAQCFPCLPESGSELDSDDLPEVDEDPDPDEEEEEEDEQAERVTRYYGVPRDDYPFKRDTVIAAAEEALSGMTKNGIYLYYKGAYVFEHNCTDAEMQRAVEALNRVGLTVIDIDGENDYDIVPIDDSDRRYVVQNCDRCYADVDELHEVQGDQICHDCIPTCDSCGKKDKNISDSQDKRWCGDCLKTCDNCGREMQSADDLIHEEDGGQYCEACDRQLYPDRLANLHT